MSKPAFAVGASVRVTQTLVRRTEPVQVEVVGVIESWEDQPTGSWYAHGKHDKLWLRRLKLRKSDGEIVWLVVDGSTAIAPAETAPTDGFV